MAGSVEGYTYGPELLPDPPKINGSFEGKSIVSFDQFNPSSIEYLFGFVPEMKRLVLNTEPSTMLSGTASILLFYEPSSRTKDSFDFAIQRLNGKTVVEVDPKHFSSEAKGETFEDTIKTFGSYSDMIVLRHKEVGAARWAQQAKKSVDEAKSTPDLPKHVPIINAGDGIGEHPTQALLDLYTIREHTGRLDNLSVVAGGDILNGRTIHSLLRGLAMYPGNRVHLLSPDLLKLPSEEIKRYEDRGLEIIEIDTMEDIPKTADIWYWTRVQRERMMHLSDQEYEELRDKFIVSPETMEQFAGDHTGIMHPLPRVGEILPSVDRDPRALYFRTQVPNGMYVRMVLSALALGKLK